MPWGGITRAGSIRIRLIRYARNRLAAAADDLVSDWNGLKNCLYIFGIDISYPGKHRYGMRTVDAVLIKGARSFRAKEQQTYLTVAFPATIPVILTGCS
ncbi:hypothetical protein AB9M92_07770 [Peribacillus frigoritolerans]|uniref:hypothetical protein n=1 Tax=Peribacillus frigoritolerans TaxID=450367 RepID=UPI003519848C